MTEPEVPHPLRPILKNWLWEHGHIGTRFLDCVAGELKFDEGKKARFTAEHPFYISLRKEDTAQQQTPWAVHDASIAKFLRAAQSAKPEEAGTPAEVQRSVQECIDIAIRCAYQADAFSAHQRYSEEAMFDDEIRDAVFADIRKKYLPYREQFVLFDFIVLYGFPNALQIGESPWLDWRIHAKPAQAIVSLPLAPYALLVGGPSVKTSRAAPVVWNKVLALGPMKDHNKMQFAQAKQWLVAITDAELAVLVPPKVVINPT